jgi:hypothetical protein
MASERQLVLPATPVRHAIGPNTRFDVWSYGKWLSSAPASATRLEPGLAKPRRSASRLTSWAEMSIAAPWRTGDLGLTRLACARRRAARLHYRRIACRVRVSKNTWRPAAYARCAAIPPIVRHLIGSLSAVVELVLHLRPDILC